MSMRAFPLRIPAREGIHTDSVINLDLIISAGELSGFLNPVAQPRGVCVRGIEPQSLPVHITGIAFAKEDPKTYLLIEHQFIHVTFHRDVQALSGIIEDCRDK